MEKPFPVPTPTSKPFWDALAEHRVRIQRCKECEKFVFYPRVLCPHCLGDLDWKEIAGTGRLYTFTVNRRPPHPLFADEVPHLLAVVELDEGPRVTSTLVNVKEEDIRVGMRLEPYFDDVPEKNVTLLRYQPAKE